MDEWRAGTVISLDYKEDNWPLGKVVPYEVELDDNEYSQTCGSFIHVSADIDACIRLPSSQTPPLVYYKAPEFSTCVSLVIASLDQRDAIAAMEAIYGFEWADQFMEERRCDGSLNRNLKEFF